jgi:hypothetical protein
VVDNPLFQELMSQFGPRFAEVAWDLPPDPEPWDLKDIELMPLPLSAEIAYVKRLITVGTDTQLMEIVS